MCNPNVLGFIKRSLPYWPEIASVLEVGSRNVNGSPRDVVYKGEHSISHYVGVDLVDGPCVDVVADVEQLDQVELFPNKFNVAISAEMLEHVNDWKQILIQIEKRLIDGGLLVLTTVSPGFEYHPYPIDKWRFTREDMETIFQIGWNVLALETWIDPGQHAIAPYHGVGVVARRLSAIPASVWELSISGHAVIGAQ